MSNSFLSASSIPGGLLPSPSANLFERSIGTLLSTFKYSVADPINTDANNVRPYQQQYQQAPQYQYSQPQQVNNVNMVMGPNGPVPSTSGMIPISNNHKSVKKTTLYGELMAQKLEKGNKAGTNLAVPSTTNYTNINLAAPTNPTYTNENIKTSAPTASTTNNTNTFQIPPPVNVNAPSQITLQSNYPPPPPPQPAGAAPVIQISPQNSQPIQNVAVQPGTYQNISYQQPTNISIGSNFVQPPVNKVNPSPTLQANTAPAPAGQAIYPTPIQIPSIQQNVNTTNFQAQGQRTQYAPIGQLPNSNSTSSQQQIPNQKMEENSTLLSNHLQQNVAPTLNYIVGVFMDSVDSMQQNIDFFQSGTAGYSKNADNGTVPKINYHPNMLTLFNDGLVDENTNKSYVVNYNNNENGVSKDDSKIINQYFNWDELLSDTDKAQKSQVAGNTQEFQQPGQPAQQVSVYNNFVPTQTVNVQQPVQQGQTQAIQLQPQQITVNGQPAQNIQIPPQQISINNPAQPQQQIQQQTIGIPGQSQNPQLQIQLPGAQIQQQSLPIQQINVQNPSIAMNPQQTSQLRTQNVQPAGATNGQPQSQQQQPMVVMVEPGTNYQTTIYQPQNAINQSFVGQTANANQQQTFNTFNQQPAQSQTQFNTFTSPGQQPQINYTITQTNQPTTQQTLPPPPSNQIQNNTVQTVEQPQSSQPLMFKGDTQDITRMSRVENTTNNATGENVQFYQGANGNASQIQDGKLLNKSMDNLNSTSTSVTVSNTNGTITDTANSNATTLDSATTNNTPIITKPRRKERPSTKPKPFKCPTCQQTFSRSHDLKRHIYTHTGIKPFKCEKCGKSFSRRDALNRHSKGEINCIRYLNKLNNMKKQQNKAKQQQEAKVQTQASQVPQVPQVPQPTQQPQQ